VTAARLHRKSLCWRVVQYLSYVCTEKRVAALPTPSAYHKHTLARCTGRISFIIRMRINTEKSILTLNHFVGLEICKLKIKINLYTPSFLTRTAHLRYYDMSTLCLMMQRSCYALAGKQFRADSMTSHFRCLRRCRETGRHLVRQHWRGRRDVTVLLNNATTVATRPPAEFAYISEAISSFSRVRGVTVKQSLCKDQFSRAVFKEQSYE
jgi:hypothetical protein